MTPVVHRIEVERGESVAIDCYPVASGARAVLYVPGLGSNRRGEKAVHFGTRFNEKGWTFAAVDLRGHGDSDGSVRDLTMTRMLADLEAAVRWLGSIGAGRDIVLIGSSMGAAVVAWHALLQRSEVGPVVLLAPALKFPRDLDAALTPDEREHWRRTGARRFRNEWIDLEIGYRLVEDGERYEPDRLVRQFSAQTLIIHGKRDDTVDWRASVEFAWECIATVDLFLVGDGDHRLTDQKALVFDIIWDWLQRRAGTATGTV